MRSARFFTLLLLCLPLSSADAKGPKYTDPKKADKDFADQGEYVGSLDFDGNEIKIGMQLIALGEGKFHSVGYVGGLPGEGWADEERHEADGIRTDDGVKLESDHIRTLVADGKAKLYLIDGDKQIGELKRIERKSETLGMKPPAGATVLFDGTNADEFKDGKLSDEKLLLQGTTSKQTFQDHQLHVEFMLPYQPEDRGQGRGNSGIYLQGRYEVQMLDSFGLEGKDNECGGLYSIKQPDLNMCFPPLTWQTYDIDFTAAKFDDEGKVTSNARITVRHNGKIIHKNVELPKSTTASPLKVGPDAGPIHLQDHGCPVRYRNIWVVKK